jgi:two-component system LytT family sensor kinase
MRKICRYLAGNTNDGTIQKKFQTLPIYRRHLFIFPALGELVKNPETFGLRVLNNIWRVSYVVFFNYLLFEFTLPKLSWKNFLIRFSYPGTYIFLFLGIVCMESYWCCDRFLYAPVTFASYQKNASDQMAFSMMSLLFFTIVRHLYLHLKLRQATQQLRIEKQAAELSYLKSQTNPHFLFNTLNNIYSLARDKSDLAPESILRLSEILRFMLYETNSDYISIDQELKVISDYIDLEKLRYDETLSINFNYNVEDMKQSVPPLLLIPLVENAFKHGISETRGATFLDIHLALINRNLLFTVKNSIEEHPEKTEIQENIGLSNLRRQLTLLYKDYKLLVSREKGVFTVNLHINLSSHV